MAKRRITEINEAIARKTSGASSKQTEINAEIGRKATEINPNVGVVITEVNDLVGGTGGAFTEVNPVISGQSADIPKDTILLDKYVVGESLSATSGEANLYLCKYGNQDYVAKVYRRQSAIKSDIVVALGDMDSPNIAKLYATGEWNGFPFEILPYYKYGSLEGKTFSFEQLRKNIIPALNNGIKALHDHDIIHKDLKPSNIMMCDDQKNVAIIDFGISSIREGGATVVVTNTGMTPEYSAPETFRGLFLEESDYYSLGVTLYQLYTGHTPYSGLDRDTIEKYVAIQSIPFPEAFPPELKRLVIGLTYNDITNRRDKANPNRRWTYEEVEKWCNGKKVELPGGAEAQTLSNSALTPMPAFRFQYKKYATVEELAEALGNDWNNGKKRLYRSLLSAHFKSFDPEIANMCIDAEETVTKDPSRADVEFFGILYKMSPHLKSFHWQVYHYESMQELGMFILTSLRSMSSKTLQIVGEFCENHLFSFRERIIAGNKESRASSIEAIESLFLRGVRENDVRIQREQAFLLGYIYSESKDLVVSYGKFDTVDALTDYIKMVIKDHPNSMDSVSQELMQRVALNPDNGTAQVIGDEIIVANPQFAAWLNIQGKQNIFDFG